MSENDLLTAALARQLLAAGFGALQALDPDGAADALLALIEGDALATILARANEEDIREALAAREPCPPELTSSWQATVREVASEAAEADRQAVKAGARSPVRDADDMFDAAFGTRPGGTARTS